MVMYTLLYLKWISCSTFCGSLDGRGVQGEWIHVHVRLSPLAVHWNYPNIVTWLYPSTTEKEKLKTTNTQKTGFKSLYTPSSPNHPCLCSLKWKSLSRVWLCTPIRSAKLLCPWSSPGKNTWVATHSLLQGSFQTLGSNLALLHCGQMFFTIWVRREVPAMFSVSANSVRINLLEPGNCKISLATPFKTLSRFNQLYCFPINIPICYPLLSIYIDKLSFFSFFF